MNLQTEPIEEYKAPSEETAWSRVKKALAPLGVIACDREVFRES